MKKINLRDYYPFYSQDSFEIVSDDVATCFVEFERREAAYQRRTYRHKAYFSLDREDGIEQEAVFVALSPYEIYERKVTIAEINAALASLPKKQADRIYAHYFRGESKSEIARADGVSKSTVCESIENGLRGMETFLKKLSV